MPTERYLVSTLLDYQVNEGVNSFVEATFAQTRTESELEPFPHSNSDLGITGIPLTNPFVPQALRDAAAAAVCDADGNPVTPETVPCPADEISYFRRTTELGQRGATSTRNTYRILVGLEGDVAENYNWQTYFGFGRMDDAQQGGGQINVLNMREALNVVDGDGNPGTFDPVCADAVAVAQGCVPINLFGLGSISPAAADYVRAPNLAPAEHRAAARSARSSAVPCSTCRLARSALLSASSTATSMPRTCRTCSPRPV